MCHLCSNAKCPLLPKLLRFRLFATMLHDTYRNDTCADMSAVLTNHLRAETASSSELQAFEKTSTSSRKTSMKNGKFHPSPTERLSTLCRRSQMVCFLAFGEAHTVLAWSASTASRYHARLLTFFSLQRASSTSICWAT